jgi:hypothetical protein
LKNIFIFFYYHYSLILFHLPSAIPAIAYNVVAALRRRRLTAVCAGHKTCKFALPFGRATPPLA